MPRGASPTQQTRIESLDFVQPYGASCCPTCTFEKWGHRESGAHLGGLRVSHRMAPWTRHPAREGAGHGGWGWEMESGQYTGPSCCPSRGMLAWRGAGNSSPDSWSRPAFMKNHADPRRAARTSLFAHSDPSQRLTIITTTTSILIRKYLCDDRWSLYSLNK